MDPIKTGRIISEKRKEFGLTQKALAEKVGVTGKAVSKWERGLSFPDITVLLPLSESLDVSLNDLLKGEIMETKIEANHDTAHNESSERIDVQSNDDILESTIAHYSDEKKKSTRKHTVFKAAAFIAIILLACGIVQLKTKQAIAEQVDNLLAVIDDQKLSLYYEDQEFWDDPDNASLNYIELSFLNSYGGIWPGVGITSQYSFEEGDLGSRVLVNKLDSKYSETTQLYGNGRNVNRLMAYEALINFTLSSTLDELEYQFKDCYITVTREEIKDALGIDDFKEYQSDEAFSKLLKSYRDNSMDYETIGTVRLFDS